MPRSVFSCRRFPRPILTSLFVVALPLAGVKGVASVAIAAPVVTPPAAKAAAPQPPVAPQLPVTQMLVAQGTLHDAENKPVKGATVALLRVGREEQDGATIVAHTDEQGHFTLKAEFSPDEIKLLSRLTGLDALTEATPPAATVPAAPHLLVLIHASGFATCQQVLNTAPPKRPDFTTNDFAANDFTLTRGFGARGQVVDAEGKPVAGAVVRPQWLQGAGADPSYDTTVISFGSLPERSPLWPEIQATSDAQGYFTLSDLPQGTVSVSLEDPRFVSQGIELQVTDNADPAPNADPLDEAATLVARIGGIVRGRVLYPDGKPVANVVVRANNERSAADAKTKADGTYTVTGVSVGKVTLTVSSPSTEWAVTSGPTLEVKAAQTVTAADLTLSHGVLLEGYVRDEANRAPLEGVSVSYSASNRWASTKTDAQGRYQIRVSAGDVRFDVNEVPPEYVQSYNGGTQVTVSEQSRKAPDFLLVKGITLTGTAKDEKGQPAVGATLSARSDFGREARTIVDAQGNWTLRGVSDRDWQNNRVTSVKLKATGAWQLQGNTTVNLPAPPLALVVNHITLQNVTVRVVTPTGQPIPHVKVSYKLFLDEEHNSYTNGSMTSNAQGDVTFPKMRPEQAAELTARKAGYVMAQKGSVTGTKTGGGAARTHTDITMTPLDAQVSGRVLDAQGQPAQGVTVSALSPNDLRDLPDNSVQTDAQGRFTLKGLAGGEVTIGAARGRAFGQIALKTGAEAELKLGAEEPLVPPQAVELAFQQLEQWAKETTPATDNNGRQKEYQVSLAANKLARYDVERAQRIMTDANGTINSAFAYMAPLSLARTDPKRALALSKTLFLLIKEPNSLLDLRLRLALRIAAHEPEAARQTYEEIAPNIAPNEFTAGSSPRYAELAALASALHNPDAEGWLQALTLCITPITADQQRYYLDSVIKLLAEGDLPTARRWAAQLNPALQLQVLGSLTAWAAQRDVTAARAILGDMTALAARPDFPLDPARNGGNYRPSTADTVNTARVALVRALMSTDLKAAQALVSPTDDARLRNEIEARLAGANDAEALRTMIDAAGQTWQNPAGEMARIASFIATTLPQVSARGFRDARAKLATHSNEMSNDESAAFYAYAAATANPAASRLLLENEWLRTRQAQQAGGGEANQWDTSSRQMNVIRAMLPLSVPRANEMLQLVQAGNAPLLNGGYAMSTIIEWLLGDEAARRSLPVERYGRGDDED